MNFVGAEKKLSTLLTKMADVQKTRLVYKKVADAQELLQKRFETMSDAMTAVLVSAQWDATSQEFKNHEKVFEDVATKFATADNAATHFLGTFPLDVSNHYADLGERAPPSNNASESSDKSSAPKSNQSLLPPVLKHEDDFTQWEAWLVRFEAWFTSSNFEQCSNQEQILYLFSVIDTQLQAVISPLIDMQSTPVFGKTNAPGCIDRIRQEFQTTDPVFARRVRFFNMQQRPGQSEIEFISSVRNAFGTAQVASMGATDFQVHMVLKGSTRLQEDLLRLQNPTMEDIIAAARTKMAQEASTAALQGPAAQVNAVSKPPPNDTVKNKKDRLFRMGIRCYRCASRNHIASDCREYGLKCSSCHKNGHVAETCFQGNSREGSFDRQKSFEARRTEERRNSFRRGRRSPDRDWRRRARSLTPRGRGRSNSGQRNISTVDVNYAEKSDEENSEINVIEVGSITKKQDMMVKIVINKKELVGAANPDTGAMCTVVAMDWVKQLGEEHAVCPVQPGFRLVAANNSTIDCAGYIKLEIHFQNSRIFTRAIVSSDVKSKILIGKDDLIKMGVIHPNFPSVEIAAVEQAGQLNSTTSGENEGNADQLGIDERPTTKEKNALDQHIPTRAQKTDGASSAAAAATQELFNGNFHENEPS